jgi:hypothetical protein
MNEARAERPLFPTTIEMEERGLIEPEWRGRQRGQAPFPTTIEMEERCTIEAVSAEGWLEIGAGNRIGAGNKDRGRK